MIQKLLKKCWRGGRLDLQTPIAIAMRRAASTTTITGAWQVARPPSNDTRSTFPMHSCANDHGGSRRLSMIVRGTDLLEDSLAHGPRRKIILESYAPSGVDVKGLIQVGDSPEDGDIVGEDKILHMNGSIVAFPDSCYLFNVTKPSEVTLETLSVVKLYRPTVEYLFIGSDRPMHPRELERINKDFRKRDIVVQHFDIMNAMGTFNILNGEDRRVACVLIIDPNS